MSIKNLTNTANGEIGVRNQSGNAALKRQEQEQKNTPSATRATEDTVNLSSSASLFNALQAEDISLERSDKVAHIKSLVQSGKYFEQRTVSDIAKILDERLGEDIELEKLFTGEA